SGNLEDRSLGEGGNMLNALADLFNIGPELSKGNLAQLVCPMTEDAFRYLAEQRYAVVPLL
ncbi:hypothetical protein, partial [Escherichia coli]|uniref:hypothetical protein n=1 Tax=Escherichia coli TaxID=562 RepID=UPI0028DD8577